jgi:hypothetical protein
LIKLESGLEVVIKITKIGLDMQIQIQKGRLGRLAA